MVRARAAAGRTDEDAVVIAGMHATRRDVLRLALALGVSSRAPVHAARAGDAVTSVAFDGVANERWVDVPVETSVPASWSSRPGQRTKQSKFMLYTDTYGPNYRYTTTLPRYVDGDGAVAANSVRPAIDGSSNEHGGTVENVSSINQSTGDPRGTKRALWSVFPC